MQIYGIYGTKQMIVANENQSAESICGFDWWDKIELNYNSDDKYQRFGNYCNNRNKITNDVSNYVKLNPKYIIIPIYMVMMSLILLLMLHLLLYLLFFPYF